MQASTFLDESQQNFLHDFPNSLPCSSPKGPQQSFPSSSSPHDHKLGLLRLPCSSSSECKKWVMLRVMWHEVPCCTFDKTTRTKASTCRLISVMPCGRLWARKKGFIAVCCWIFQWFFRVCWIQIKWLLHSQITLRFYNQKILEFQTANRKPWINSKVMAFVSLKNRLSPKTKILISPQKVVFSPSFSTCYLEKIGGANKLVIFLIYLSPINGSFGTTNLTVAFVWSLL